jgi:hypothetical protein
MPRGGCVECVHWTHNAVDYLTRRSLRGIIARDECCELNKFVIAVIRGRCISFKRGVYTTRGAKRNAWRHGKETV